VQKKLLNINYRKVCSAGIKADFFADFGKAVIIGNFNGNGF